MPPNDSLGLYDDQWLLPVAPEATKHNPEKTVFCLNLRPFLMAFPDGQLLRSSRFFKTRSESFRGLNSKFKISFSNIFTMDASFAGLCENVQNFSKDGIFASDRICGFVWGYDEVSADALNLNHAQNLFGSDLNHNEIDSMVSDRFYCPRSHLLSRHHLEQVFCGYGASLAWIPWQSP